MERGILCDGIEEGEADRGIGGEESERRGWNLIWSDFLR